MLNPDHVEAIQSVFSISTLAAPKVKAELADLRGMLFPSSSVAFAKFCSQRYY
jgi:hypothetical protein